MKVEVKRLLAQGCREITIREVAELASVSTGYASKLVNGHQCRGEKATSFWEAFSKLTGEDVTNIKGMVDTRQAHQSISGMKGQL